MKTEKYDFEWFDKEDGRKCLRASVGTDRKLHLGEPLRKILPDNIIIGFDARHRVLAIKSGNGRGQNNPKCGIISAKKLAKKITGIGLELPLSFSFGGADADGVFKGCATVPKISGKNKREREKALAQAIILFKPILDGEVYTCAKSTPIGERKVVAQEALLAALQEIPAYEDDTEAYIRDRIRTALLLDNKYHVEHYRDHSLDRKFTDSDGEEGKRCLYDTIAAQDSGGIDAADDKIMAEQFW